MRRPAITNPYRLVASLLSSAWALSAILGGCGEEAPRERVDRLVAELGWRPPAGRLCCDIEHRPPPSPTAVPEVPRRGLARAFGDLTRRHREAPRAETAAGLGVLEMLEGDWPSAIGRYEEALRLAPERGDLLADLAVARMSRGVAEDRPLELLQALRHTLEATHLAPELPEAWFNHAALLERLELRAEAAKAWSRFLEVEGDAGWRVEAEARRREALDRHGVEVLAARLAVLEAGGPVDRAELRGLVQEQPHLVRESAEERLLGRWGEAFAAGRGAEAEALLWLAEGIGAELAGRWSDHMLADATAHIRSSDQANRARLATGYSLYSRGMAAYYGRRFADADSDLAGAESAFDRTGSPMAANAMLYRAICVYQEDVDASRSALASVAAAVDAERYPSLAGRISWMQGIVEMVQGRSEQAISLFELTRGYLARGSGPVRAAMADQLLGEAYDSRGEVERGWRHRLAAARVIAPSGDSRKRHAVLQDSVQALVRGEQSVQALVFLEEEVANAQAWGERAAQAEALAQRSRVRSQLGDVHSAENDALEAIDIAEGIVDVASGRRVAASARLSLGIALAESEPERSLEILRQAQSEHEEIGWEVERFAFYDASARAHLALGEEEAARKILIASVSTFEEIRRQALDVRSRILIFQHARRAFDLLIEFELSRGEEGIGPAFDLAERSRARYLLDRWGESAEPATLDRVVASLPAGTVMVHYAELGERIVAWVVARGAVGQIELERASKAQELSADLSQALELEQSDRVEALSAGLYDALVRPLGLDLGGEPHLVIVPEGWLARVPFAALFDRETGLYLIERAAVKFAPSATLYLRASHRASIGGSRAGRALIVAPVTSRAEWPDLPPLELATREARAIADLYPEHTLLLGAEASAEAFLSALGRHPVVHYAGHAVSRGGEMGDSWLLLSDGPRGESGTVSLARLWELQLGVTELVVLSACHGLDGFEQGREGVVSLASSFFAAGVPTVVAALWQVDDRASYRLMTRFHELVSGGEAPSVALRAVMIEEIRSEDPSRSDPAYWAVFAVLGV